jgi:hypothetical protein
MDGLGDISLINMFGCRDYGASYGIGHHADCDCAHEPRFVAALAYFASYTVLSALVVLISVSPCSSGVVQIAMDEARLRVEAERRVTSKIQCFATHHAPRVRGGEAFIRHLAAAYDLIDINGDGSLTVDELEFALECAGLEAGADGDGGDGDGCGGEGGGGGGGGIGSSITTFLAEIDRDGDGEVSKDEFVAFMFHMYVADEGDDEEEEDDSDDDDDDDDGDEASAVYTWKQEGGEVRAPTKAVTAAAASPAPGSTPKSPRATNGVSAWPGQITPGPPTLTPLPPTARRTKAT